MTPLSWILFAGISGMIISAGVWSGYQLTRSERIHKFIQRDNTKESRLDRFLDSAEAALDRVIANTRGNRDNPYKEETAYQEGDVLTEKGRIERTRLIQQVDELASIGESLHKRGSLKPDSIFSTLLRRINITTIQDRLSDIDKKIQSILNTGRMPKNEQQDATTRMITILEGESLTGFANPDSRLQVPSRTEQAEQLDELSTERSELVVELEQLRSQGTHVQVDVGKDITEQDAARAEDAINSHLDSLVALSGNLSRTFGVDMFHVLSEEFPTFRKLMETETAQYEESVRDVVNSAEDLGNIQYYVAAADQTGPNATPYTNYVVQGQAARTKKAVPDDGVSLTAHQQRRNFPTGPSATSSRKSGGRGLRTAGPQSPSTGKPGGRGR